MKFLVVELVNWIPAVVSASRVDAVSAVGFLLELYFRFYVLIVDCSLNQDWAGYDLLFLQISVVYFPLAP